MNLISQDLEIFNIIKTEGNIIDTRTGKELKIGDEVNFQTNLEFGSLNDWAVLLNPEKAGYYLKLPVSSFGNSQLTVASNIALSPVNKNIRAALVTGGTNRRFHGVAPENLKSEYFLTDTFTIIGNSFKLPVLLEGAKKYDLVLRYNNGNNIEEYVSQDFTILKNNLKLQGNIIPDCSILLREGDNTVSLTKLLIRFIDEENLVIEFDVLLKALDHQKSVNNETRDILYDYCNNIYGIIDPAVLFTVINDFLEL